MSKQQTALRLALEALKELVAQTETGLFAVRHDHVAMQDARQAITALREALAKPDFWEGYVPEPDNTCNNALREQGKAYPRTCKKCGLGPCVELAQQALNKKAENARELGLDYEPSAGAQVSKVWWDGEKLMAKQVPLGDFYKPAPVQQEPISLAGEGHELYQQLLEAGRELLRAVNEDEKWGCVGPGPTEIAWDKFSSLASHVCTGIDSPQPVQQEPVARPRGFYVFPQPAQRTWVGLTDDEMSEVYNQADWDTVNGWEYERAIEAKLKEKNT